MRRGIPVVATLVVLVAIGAMIALGVWQLQRLDQKEALLARYETAAMSPQVAEWPSDPAAADGLLYRRARLTCARIESRSAMAGHNIYGQPGWAQTATCAVKGGGTARVVLGWTLAPDGGETWTGGRVTGWIAPGPRLVADPPLGGLEQIARPDPSEIPNNHLSYAVQWFLFAFVALVIYVVALNRRGKDRAQQ